MGFVVGALVVVQGQDWLWWRLREWEWLWSAARERRGLQEREWFGSGYRSGFGADG